MASSSKPFAGAESGSPGRALEAGKGGSPGRAVQAGIRGKRLIKLSLSNENHVKGMTGDINIRPSKLLSTLSVM